MENNHSEDNQQIIFPEFVQPNVCEESQNGNAGEDNNGCSEQRHVHEFTGSVMLAESGEDRHNHRFAGISGQAIGTGRNHVHEIKTRTDFFEDHFHEINVKSGPAIFVGRGKHVHFVQGRTSENDGHRHRFIFATLIESPLTEDKI